MIIKRIPPILSLFYLLILVIQVVFSSGLVLGQTIKPSLHQSGIHTTEGSTFSSSLAKQPGAQNIHVLAIRAEFQRDTVASTTGNGLFQMEKNPRITIDPPPHNREYFEDHMEALRRYYVSVSRGKVSITYDVFPKNSTDVYHLPHTMNYYSPSQSDELLDKRLSELLRDALMAAAQDTDIDFSKYQSFIVFHSGVGADFVLDANFNPTPNDVSSVFLDFNHLKRTLGKGQENFKGIPVNNNSVFIREGLILPETESKQGYEIGLNGIIAHQFGHQLGLPSLFNTDDGRPAIGKWGLMDVGFGNINGLVPAQPCAWSKVFLGWEQTVEIREGAKIPLYASLSQDPRRIYKIPISKEEYFLIENRQQDYAKDSLRSVISPRGVLLEVDDYDFDIPGSGLLVWHIDERVIAQGLKNNTVNADPLHRGIDLEEADGAQDIGEIFEGALPGFALPVNGIPEDAYYSGNNDKFTPETNPNSNSYYRANSHISITSISKIDTVMTFSVSIGFQRAGFPQFMGSTFSGLSPAVGLLDDKQQGIVAVTSSGDVIVIKGNDGKPLLGMPENRMNINHLEDTTLTPVTIFAKVTPPVRTSPVLWRLPSERYSAAALVDGRNTLHVWKLADNNGDGWGDVLVEKPLIRQITSELVVQTISSNNIGLCFGDVEGHVTVLNNDGTLFWESPSVGEPVTGLALVETGALYTDGIAVITKRGKVTSFSMSGSVNWTKELNFTGAYPPAVAAMIEPMRLNIICIDSVGHLAVLDEKGNFLQGFPKQEPAKFMSPPALGDVDGDGYLDIIILGEREVYGYNFTGASLDNFPLALIRSDSGTVGHAQPLLADLNADGKMEIITGSIGGTITALNSNGEVMPDFPFACGELLSGTPAIADIDDDKNLNLIIGNDDTWLYDWALNISAITGKVAWGGYLGNARHTGQAIQKASPNGTAIDRLLEKESVYNYPNPVEGSTTFIHFKVNEFATVTITIYDQVGDKIDSFTTQGLPGIENEFQCAVDKLATGVYLTKVEAVSKEKKEYVIFKMAVIR